MKKFWIGLLIAFVVISSFYYWNFHYDKIYLFGRNIPEHQIDDELESSLELQIIKIKFILEDNYILTDSKSKGFFVWLGQDSYLVFNYNKPRIRCMLLDNKEFYSFDLPRKESKDFYKYLLDNSEIINRDVSGSVDKLQELIQDYEEKRIENPELEIETDIEFNGVMTFV